MTHRLALATSASLLLSASLAGCASRPAATSAAADSAAVTATDAPAATVVTIRQEGGIAGLVTEATVDGVARRYQTVTRHMCGAEGATCPPPIDSASGALSDSLAAAVASAVDAADFFALRADYGTDPRLRDGFAYTVTVRRGTRAASVRADQSTRPPALATLTDDVVRAIDRARGRR